MRGMDNFDVNVKLIENVKNQPVLYDTNMPEYTIKQHTDTAWKAVAKEVGISVNECKTRWRNLRISFSRYVRINRSTEKKMKPYYLLEHMSFMFAFVKQNDNGNLPIKIKMIEEKNNIEETERPSQKSRKEPLAEHSLRSKSRNTATSFTDNTQHPEQTTETEYILSSIKTSSSQDQMNSGDTEFIISPVSESTSKKQYQGSKRKLEPELIELEITESEQNFNIETSTEAQQSAETPLLLSNMISNSPDMDFLKSVLPDMERMQPRQKSRFKMAVLMAIDDILYAV